MIIVVTVVLSPHPKNKIQMPSLSIGIFFFFFFIGPIGNYTNIKPHILLLKEFNSMGYGQQWPCQHGQDTRWMSIPTK